MVQRCVQVHLGAGIGNIASATPLLVALHECDFVTDVVLAADYAETAELLRSWSAVREIFMSTTPFPSAEDYSQCDCSDPTLLLATLYQQICQYTKPCGAAA